MLQFQVIGNLGGDAKVQEKDGRKFVSFNVANTDKWTDQDGKVHETTDWISCTMNGDGGNILPYLTTGTKVYVEGRGSVRLYSSPKDRMMKAGANINVTRIELVGGTSDAIPSQLFDTATGEMHRIDKYYFDAEFSKLKFDGEFAYLADRKGRLYMVNKSGWVAQIQDDRTQQSQHAEGDTQTNEQWQDGQPFLGEENNAAGDKKVEKKTEK